MCYSKSMRFQERDGVILSAIYQHDGILSRRRLKALFWPTASLRAVQKRLGKLVDNGYLARPSKLQQQTQPIPEPVYWLDWQGILWIAGQTNVALDPPANTGENQMRKLANQVRDAGLHWLREPRWNQLTHDLAVIDFQFSVEHALAQLPSLRLELWHHESVFRSDGDVISFQLTDRNGNTQKRERRIYPDSFFIITNQLRSTQGLTSRARLLFELDNATHPNARFGREKVAPGIAYIKSQPYKKRFGDNSGRWLIVTTGAKRMKNLMEQTRTVGGSEAGVFLFTTMEWLEDVNVLIEPVWWQVDGKQPVPLFTV